MIYVVITFIVSMLFLVKSSDYFVERAKTIASNLGVSEFVIGLTIVAIGTSLPELVSSGIASYTGSGGIAFGNVAGSNIANIGLILGLSAVIMPIKSNAKIFYRDDIVMLAVTVLFAFMVSNGVVSNVEGLVLFTVFFVYVAYLFLTKKKFSRRFHFRSYFEGDVLPIRNYASVKRVITESYEYLTSGQILDYLNRKHYEKLLFSAYAIIRQSIIGDLIALVFAGGLIFLSANYLVRSSIDIAMYFGVSEAFIAVSVIAFGTSLPELSVSLSALRKGFSNIVLGNVVGSNITNVLVVMGVASILNPVHASSFDLLFVVPSLLVITTFGIVFMRTRYEISRYEGLALLCGYVGFMSILAVSSL